MMRKYVKLAGLGSVYAGVLLLVVAFLMGWTRSNAVLFSALFLVVAGIVGFVVATKKESRY